MLSDRGGQCWLQTESRLLNATLNVIGFIVFISKLPSLIEVYSSVKSITWESVLYFCTYLGNTRKFFLILIPIDSAQV